MTDDKDRRKIKRRHLIYYLRVFDRNTGQMLGHLVDVTHEGVLLMHEDPIEMDKEFDLRMDLPIEVWGETHLDFKAKSIRSSRDVNPDFLNTGFKLTETDWKTIEVVERLINRFGFKD